MYNNYKQKEMKQLKVFYVINAILLSGMMFSCGNSSPVDDNNSSSSNGTNNLSAGQIEMKAYPWDDHTIAFSATTQKITIDWGDGNVVDLTPNGVQKSFLHSYSYYNQNWQTIKVNTEGMSEFSCYLTDDFPGDIGHAAGYFQELKFGNCSELKSINCGGYSDNTLAVLDISKCTALTNLQCDANKLTSLDVSKCKALTNLNCGFNQLTSLDVSKCTALTSLNCFDNGLSVTALNALFNSLPTRRSSDNARIDCYNNPGYDICDMTIAQKKGWTVSGSD